MSIEPALAALDETTFDSVLCVVAHPDDIEYGTSAAVAKWDRGGQARALLPADPW